MEKFTFNPEKKEKNMENFPNITRDLFGGNYEAFKQAVTKGLEDEKNGGYIKGTPGFCRHIFNGVRVDDQKTFAIYRKEIMKAVSQVEQEQTTKKTAKKKHDPIASNPKIRSGAMRAEQRAKKELKMLGREDY